MQRRSGSVRRSLEIAIGAMVAALGGVSLTFVPAVATTSVP